MTVLNISFPVIIVLFTLRQENKEAQLNLAEVHLKLGEIKLEQGKGYFCHAWVYKSSFP